jgi:beta-lactamase class A
VKEPVQKSLNVRPFFRVKPTRSRGRRQGHAYQAYQQARRRQQRIAILVLGLLLLLSLTGLSIWGAVRAAQPLLEAWMPLEVVETNELRDMLTKDVGFPTQASLLYDDTRDFAALSAPVNGFLKDKLLPILPMREDSELKAELQAVLSNFPSTLVPHLYYYNPYDGSYVEVNGYKPVAAASVIKLPILLDYLMSLDKNLMQMDTPLLFAEFHRAGGSGELQGRDSGVMFPANHVAGQMIRISDNTCTNIMIDALGGMDILNRKLAALGLTRTRIRNWLPDLEGSNTISAYEMATILYNVDQGPLVSDIARYDGIGILESTHNRRLLVSPLPNNVRVAHKTGDIGTSLGDSGIVYMPDGGKYIISIQVERPFNDYTARDLIQQVSRSIYDHVVRKRQATTLQAHAVN